MTPEDIAALLKDVGIKQLIDTLKIVDPDLSLVYESVQLIRNQGFGNVNIKIVNGKIVLIEPTMQIAVKKIEVPKGE